MSWHTKENYEVSEVHPRMQAPRGHGLNGVARVQPMVPEVSVFSHPSTTESRLHRQPLTPTNGRRERSVEDSLCRTIPLKKAPRPQQPPMRADFRASEIEVSMAPPPSEQPRSMTNFEEQKAMLNNPEDLFKVLSWQNEQLMRLQEQVRQLLACQSPAGSSTADSSFELRQQSKIMVDSSTQVSTPNSPVKNQSILRNATTTANKTDIFEATFNPESLPLGASAGKLASPTPPPAPYFEEDEDDDDDINQIQCRDVQPVGDLDELIGQFKINEEVVEQPPKEESCIEVRRLRDMGVSFISKEDLYPRKEDKKETSVWYPQAMDPFQNGPSVASTSDYSLMINSAALKYLNDAQLTQVARKSPHSNVSFEPANVTRYGLPEHNISQSTRQFLSSNDLTKKPSSH